MVQDTAAKVSAGSPPAKKKSAFMYRRDRIVHLPPGWRVDWLLPSRWDAFMWVARREVAGKQYRKLRVGACHLRGRGRARAGRDGQPLPASLKRATGSLVHYAFGGSVGVLYGALTAARPALAAGYGTPLGTAVWIVADELGMPMSGLAKPPRVLNSWLEDGSVSDMRLLLGSHDAEDPPGSAAHRSKNPGPESRLPAGADRFARTGFADGSARRSRRAFVATAPVDC